MRLPAQTIRSRRRTLALQVKPDGSLIVRAPLFARESAIHRFIRQNQAWIEKTVQAVRERLKAAPARTFDEGEIKAHREKAAALFAERCEFYAAMMGVSYKRVALSNARSRWGSCSPRGSVRLNWRLVLAPAEVLDYVVVHELAHLKELNHSKRFWTVVAQALPDYRASKKWLRVNGAQLHI